MTEAVVVIVVVLASILIGWLFFAGVHRVGQSRGRKEEQRTAETPDHHKVPDRDGSASVDQKPATAEAARQAEKILEDARRSAARITAEATHTASKTLGDAEKKAKAMLEEIEGIQTRVREQMARDQGLVDERRNALSNLLLSLLAQLQRRAGDGSTNLQPLNEVREARDGKAAPPSGSLPKAPFPKS